MVGRSTILFLLWILLLHAIANCADQERLERRAGVDRGYYHPVAAHGRHGQRTGRNESVRAAVRRQRDGLGCPAIATAAGLAGGRARTADGGGGGEDGRPAFVVAGTTEQQNSSGRDQPPGMLRETRAWGPPRSSAIYSRSGGHAAATCLGHFRKVKIMIASLRLAQNEEMRSNLGIPTY